MTDPKVIALRVAAAQAKGEDARRKALLSMHPDAKGSADVRRLWLWIRDEVLLPQRRAGNWVASDTLDLALKEFPEIQIALARDRAAIEIDDAAYHADIARLKAEARTSTTSEGNPHAR